MIVARPIASPSGTARLGFDAVSARAPRGGAAQLGALIGWGEPAVPIVDGAQAAPSFAWPAGLGLNAAAALLLAAVAANGSRAGEDWAVVGFYAAIALLFLPFAARILYPPAARGERIANLVLVTAALFLARVIREPIAFLDHDEFLHWSTANHILETGSLFAPNPLLPVSPLYPGLELVTTALTNLSGLSVFAAAVLLLAAARLTFVLTLFLVYERVAGSARAAACGCLVYMGSSTFLVFDSQFSYESLAVVFVAALLLADARAASEGRVRHVALVLLPLLAALAVTHHMTAFFAAGLFVALAGLELLRAGPPRVPVYALVSAVMAVALPLGWSHLMGDPSSGYLGPVIAGGLHEAAQLLTFSGGRTFFVSEDGSVAPLWQRLVAMGSVVIVALGLLTGFLRALAQGGLVIDRRSLLGPHRSRGWNNSRLVLLTGLTLAFPLSILFRLTRSGWEIGNRIGPFSFLGVGLVLAIAVGTYWQGRSRSTAGTVTLAGAGAILLIGGIISAQGPRILVPAQFKVSADAASVEPMGISAALWSLSWLGPGNLFASDRINRLLLATYGRQEVATTLQDGVDTGEVIMARTLGAREVGLLREIGVAYVTVDLRLTTALPVVGVYFDGGDGDHGHARPPRADTLLKFNQAPGVGRIFDDGYLVTYDVRTLGAAR